MTDEIKGFGAAPLKQEGEYFFPFGKPDDWVEPVKLTDEEITKHYRVRQELSDEAKLPTDALSPEEFHSKVRRIMFGLSDLADQEETHVASDNMVEELLIALGYGDAIQVIRSYGRWYA